MARSLTLTSPVRKDIRSLGQRCSFPADRCDFSEVSGTDQCRKLSARVLNHCFPPHSELLYRKKKKFNTFYQIMNYERGRERVVGRQGHSTDSCVLPHCIVTETIYVQTTEYPSQIYKHHKVLIEIIYGRALCTHSILSSTTCKM